MDTATTSAAPNQDAGGWGQAAASAAGINKPMPSSTPDQSSAGAAAIEQPRNAAAAPQQQAPAAPPAVTALPAPPQTAKAVRPGGIRGFIDRMVDSLAGTDTSRVRQDPDGNVYFQHSTPTSGQQWLRIGAEALMGAGAGLAQRGAGSKGAALGAGIEAGQRFRQQENVQNQQQLEQLANITALNHQTAANALKLTQMQFEVSKATSEFQHEWEGWMKDSGAEMVTHADSLQDVTKFMREHPDYNHGDQAQNVTFRAMPTFGANGKATGFDIYRVDPQSQEEMLPAGTKVPFYNPVTKQMEMQALAGPKPRAFVNSLWAAAGNAQLEAQGKEADINFKNAEAAAKKNPPPKTETASETALHRAETARAWAEANKDQAAADAEKAKSKETQGPLVDEIGQGRMVPGRLGYLLAKNPELMDAVATKYPGFDSSKIDAYVSAYKDFTSGKTADQLTSGETALGHMNELRKLNTVASHIPGTPAWNAYHNKVDTLATELAKFYGDATVPAIQSIKDTLGANLPGTRDKAIQTQAESMLDRFDSFKQRWKNAAPSDAYEAKMPWISPQAETARGELDHAYHGAPAGKPAELTNLYHNPQTGQTIGWDGKEYVDATTRKPVTK